MNPNRNFLVQYMNWQDKANQQMKFILNIPVHVVKHYIVELKVGAQTRIIAVNIGYI